MVFDKIIHPEIVLGRRGSEFYKEYYDLLTKNINSLNEETAITNENYEKLNGEQKLLLDYVFNNDPNELGFIKNIISFKKSQKIFYLPKEFCKALLKINKEIPVDFVPNNFSAFIIFPDNLIEDESGYVEGAYTQTYIDRFGQKRIQVSYKDKDWNTFDFVSPIWKDKIDNIAKDQPIRELVLGSSLVIAKEAYEKRIAIVRLVLNSILYLFSADKDIIALKPEFNLTKSEKRNQISKCEIRNRCLLPIAILNWAYHTGRNYTSQSVFVEGYLAWRRCGLNWSQIKLSWISEHERNYGGQNVSVEEPQYDRRSL